MTVMIPFVSVIVGLLGVYLAAVGIGGLPFAMLALLLIGLKLGGVIVWSWWWTIVPIWGAVGGAIFKMWLATRDPLWRLK